MALIVQGDVPVAGANSYASVAEFRAHCELFGYDLGSALDAELEVFLVRATAYLDVRFRYIGERHTKGQSLEWPRRFAYDDQGDSVEGVPPAVKAATCEYAWRARTVTLAPDPVRDSTGRTVESTKVKVGEIEEEVTYADGAGSDYNMPAYPMADRLLMAKGLTRLGGGRGLISGGLMRG